MDDLDALLADLQSTTANISSYQSNNNQLQSHHIAYHEQRPQQNLSTPYHSQVNPSGVGVGIQQPILHDSQVDQKPQAVCLQQNQQNCGPHFFQGEDYNTNQCHLSTSAANTGHEHGLVNSLQTSGGLSDNGGVVLVTRESFHSSEGDSRSSTPPPLPPPPPSELLDNLDFVQDQQPIYEPQTFQSGDSTNQPVVTQRKPCEIQAKNRGDRMSALSNNLSELDQLLEDLNSAQFMAEVDRKSSITDIPGMNDLAKQPPPVAPKPTTHRNTKPNSQPSRFPVDPTYQELEPGSSLSSTHIGSSSNNLPNSTASSATKELDDLMNSLTEFKIQNKEVQPDQEPAYAKPVKSRTVSENSPTTSTGKSVNQQTSGNANGQLEDMLGDLQCDMNRHGVNTKQKGVCAACNKPIVGQVIAALGQTWHIEHFVCATCEEPLGTRNFYERDGKAYCESDYHQLFAPRCAYCNGPILDRCITALEKMWHPEHFICAQCGRPFGEEEFHEKNGKAYCRDDYFKMFAIKCGGCGQPIIDNYISALNRQWHPSCFVCWECHQPFENGSFFDYESMPYCEMHYHARKGSLCYSCQKPITGRCITAMFRKFHPEHFVCAFCLKQLNKGTFKEQNDKPYCHPCFVKLFG